MKRNILLLCLIIFTLHFDLSAQTKDETKPVINSFQLLNDGKRWWVVTIYWQNETPENPLPKEYLKSRKN